MSLTTGSQTRAAVDEFTAFYAVHFGRIATQLHAYLGDRWEARI